MNRSSTFPSASRIQTARGSTVITPSPLGTNSPLRNEPSSEQISSPPAPSAPAAAPQKKAERSAPHLQHESPSRQQQKVPPQQPNHKQQHPKSAAPNSRSTAEPAQSTPPPPSAGSTPLKRKEDSKPPVSEVPMPNKKARTQTHTSTSSTSAPQRESAATVPQTSPIETVDHVEAKTKTQQEPVVSFDVASLDRVPQDMIELIVAWSNHTAMTEAVAQEKASINRLEERDEEGTMSDNMLILACLCVFLTGHEDQGVDRRKGQG